MGFVDMIIRKQYLEKVKPFIDKDFIKVFVGVRRSGKTVLLKQIKAMLIEQGRLKDNFIEMNFESMKYAHIHTAENLYEYVSEKIENTSGKCYLLLDEIQQVEGWE